MTGFLFALRRVALEWLPDRVADALYERLVWRRLRRLSDERVRRYLETGE